MRFVNIWDPTMCTSIWMYFQYGLWSGLIMGASSSSRVLRLSFNPTNKNLTQLFLCVCVCVCVCVYIYIYIYIERERERERESVWCRMIREWWIGKDELLVHALKTWSCGGIAPLILNVGMRCTWVVSSTPQPFCPQGMSPRFPLDRRLDGSQNRFGPFGEEIHISPRAGNGTTTVHCLIHAGHVPYWGQGSAEK